MSKDKIGFKLTNKEEKTTEESLETVDHIQKMLSKEINSYQAFEQTLHQEMDDIEKMKNNMRTVQEQFGTIRHLFSSREEVMQKLYAEFYKGHGKDLHKSKEYLQMINHIDSELQQNVGRANSILHDLTVKKSHELYKESDSNARVMKDLDKQARHLLAELTMITRKMEGFNNDLAQIQQQVQRTEKERNKDS